MKKYIAFLIAFALTLACAMPVYAGADTYLNINKDSITHEVSQKLYGLNLVDDEGYLDGGLSSNLVCNNSFEYSKVHEACWLFSDLKCSTDNADPLNQNNTYYEKVTVDGQGYVANFGYATKTDDDKAKQGTSANMSFSTDEAYEFSCYLKNVDFDGTISVYLDSKANSKNVVQLSTRGLSASAWKCFSAKLNSVADEKGKLVIVFRGNGTLYMDSVRLVPSSSYGYAQEQWKYASMDEKAVRALTDLSPSFIRFGFLGANDYSWKHTIGSLEERKQCDVDAVTSACSIYNAEIGYHEYFQLCEELFATPIPVVSAGMFPQGEKYELMAEAYDKLYMTDEQYFTYLENEKGFSRHDKTAMRERAEYVSSLGINSADDWKAYISSIALKPKTDEFSNYAQDVLDLIEYANGDAQTTYWGSLRSANGHEQPFGIKYIAIGNENYGDVYARNFKALKKIINKKYPKIKVICSSGTSFNGENLDQALANANADKKNTILDEHFCVDDGVLLESNNKYDSYDRGGVGILVSGYGVSSAKPNSLYSAVQESSFLTGIERNSDIILMSSYSPTLSKLENEKPSLIWLNENDLALTPNYYARLLFANNFGKEYVNATLNNLSNDKIFQSTTVDTDSQTIFVKLVNASASGEKITINLNGFDNVNFASAQILTGSKNAVNSAKKQSVAPYEKSIELDGNSFTYTADGYSVNVLRIAYANNNGKGFYTLPDTIKQGKEISNGDIVALLFIVVMVFLFSSFVGFMLYTRLVLKKKGKPYKFPRRKKKNDE